MYMCCCITRDDSNFVEMIGQKPLSAILLCNLIGQPYIALERECVNGWKFYQNNLKNNI